MIIVIFYLFSFYLCSFVLLLLLLLMLMPLWPQDEREMEAKEKEEDAIKLKYIWCFHNINSLTSTTSACAGIVVRSRVYRFSCAILSL